MGVNLGVQCWNRSTLASSSMWLHRNSPVSRSPTPGAYSLLIHPFGSFKKHLLSTDCMPGTVSGSGQVR